MAVAAVLQVSPMVPLPLLPVEQPDLGHVAVALRRAPDQQDPEFVDPEKNQKQCCEPLSMTAIDIFPSQKRLIKKET